MYRQHHYNLTSKEIITNIEKTPTISNFISRIHEKLCHEINENENGIDNETSHFYNYAKKQQKFSNFT